MKKVAVQPEVAVKEYSANIQKIHREVSTAADRLIKEANDILSQKADKEKAKRLAKAGFGKAKEVRENEHDVKVQLLAEQTANIISYYQQKYPLYKFITMDQVKQVCKNWNLVLADAKDYTGFVPDKNLREIENAKIADADKEKDGRTKKPCELKIIAPQKNLDMRGKWVRDHIVEDDPIVLQPVRAGFLVISKWGDEASDPIVCNPIEN